MSFEVIDCSDLSIEFGTPKNSLNDWDPRVKPLAESTPDRILDGLSLNTPQPYKSPKLTDYFKNGVKRQRETEGILPDKRVKMEYLVTPDSKHVTKRLSTPTTPHLATNADIQRFWTYRIYIQHVPEDLGEIMAHHGDFVQVLEISYVDMVKVRNLYSHAEGLIPKHCLAVKSGVNMSSLDAKLIHLRWAGVSFKALFAFETVKHDEMSLEIGEIVTVDYVPGDGWCLARKNDGSVGMVPLGYLREM